MAYEVKLEVFAGPIDLLLHLITRQRVDIYDVSLARITEEYLAAVAEMPELDLERATGFLVVAAALLELKSARLLPRDSGDELESQLLEQRDLLLARLVECATYREAGSWIATSLEAGRAWHGRSVAVEPRFTQLLPDLLERVTPADVVAAAARALAPRVVPQLDTSYVAPIRASVRDAIMAVARRLEGTAEASFDELCPVGAARIDVVVHFLALLELYKAGALDLEQGDRFGTIRARWVGDVALDEVLDQAEEYVAVERARD